MIIYEVLADIEGPGAWGDGVHVFRFRTEQAAVKFAAKHTVYGSAPAEAHPIEATPEQVRRWGLG